MPAQLANEKRPFLKRNSEPSTSDSPTKIRRADSHGDQNKRLKNEDGGRIPIHPFGDVCVDDASHPDITAMSVLSLYERENEQSCSEMDTNRDFIEAEKQSPVTLAKNLSKKHQNNNNASTVHDASLRNNKNDTYYLNCPKPTIYFNDGVRSVDYILVWDAFHDDANTTKAHHRRKVFEANLIKEGLELEYEPQEKNGLNFIKVHAPKEVLRRYSEILKLRMPMKKELCRLPRDRQSRLHSAANFLRQKLPGMEGIHSRTNFIVERITDQWKKLKSYILVDHKLFPKKGYRFTAIYSRDKEYLFDVDSPCFFTPAIHSRIVQFILDRKKFSDNPNDDFAFGIERLLNEQTYSAGYPLHDGDLKKKGSTRHLLYTEWASVNKWYRYQPLDHIKDYFGVKIALYFAWLGFYTHMLLLAAVVGVGCFIYSWATLYDNQPSEDICNANITMCPLCNGSCQYWNLRESCMQARITSLFDNGTTVFFAIFMSFWATLFLEMWKRYSAEITHRWDLTGFDIWEEHPRPQYLARLSHVKRQEVNMVTNTVEPSVPFWRIKLPMTILSYSAVALLVTLAFAAVIGVVLYRMSMLAALHFYEGIALFTTCTAACINLVCIVLFNWVYMHVAEYLTELEYHRTQTEFDDSLILKIYLLEFINYYASIFYIAFYKGKNIGTPKSYNKILGYRQEECSPGGCFLELSIQLAIIMVGKQVMNSILEMAFPVFFKWLNTLKVKTGLSKADSACKNYQPQWIKDFKLVEWGPRSLFPEYLEMVLQYGFVTIFVAAFPLAPFFALLNNILEMRLDAKKLLTYYRRPVSQRVRDIGIWYRILDCIGKLSVITNGFIIAFTSDFIPKLVYMVTVNENLDGYLESSLAIFDTNDFTENSELLNRTSVKYCRYPDYREPPGSENAYERSSMFWIILAWKLVFVLIFENVVALVMIIVKWGIPDVPSALRDKIRREAYITNEIIIKQEMLRVQSGQTNKRPNMTCDTIADLTECPATPDQWDRLINKSLSGSDFDLMVHSDSLPGNFGADREAVEMKTPTSV